MKIGVIVAMESEYDALRKCGVDNVVLAGIGKVNAARTATELILRESPDCIINSGVAGGIDNVLKVGDFVVGTQVAYHDVWCGEGNLRGQVQGLPQRFDADAKLLKAVDKLDCSTTIHKGLICTGDQFISSLEEDLKIKALYPDALACDMESTAIAQVCHHFGVPFLSFRAISDVTTAEQSHQELYDGFWSDLSRNSFSIVRQLIELLCK